MKIGFIGLGIMGSRMAANILAGGHDVTVYNRSTGKADALAARGAKVAGTVQEATKDAEVVFTMLADPSAVKAVALGPDGFLQSMSEGAIWIDCSTVNPRFTREMEKEAASYGVPLIDAPVAGTKGPAEKGELTVLVGGPGKLVDQVRPLLELIGKRIVHVGATSMGASLKMVTNLMLGHAMAAYSEAQALGQSLGIPESQIADFLLGGGTAAPFLSGKRSKIEKKEYEADFPLRLMRKDLHLAAAEAFEKGIALPSTNAVKELFGQAVKDGFGDLDFSAVYRVLNDD